jgi:hypothetical protein
LDHPFFSRSEVSLGRYWWWFRLGVFCVVFVALGIFLFQRMHWGKQAARNFSADIAQGDKIVDAVEAFRGKCGLWPEYLEDLVPQYLDAIPDAGDRRHWFYELSPVADDQAPSGFRTLPSLSLPTGDEPREHIGYDFDAHAPAWHLFGGSEAPKILREEKPPKKPPALGDVYRNAIAELQRRIEREPREVEHRRGMAAIFLAMGMRSDAWNVVQQAKNDLPASYWPRLAEAILSLPATNGAATAPATAPAGNEQLEAFAQWAGQHASMTHWFYLSHAQREAGEPDAAAQSMEKAVQQPIEVAADDPNISAYYLWDMARWALETRRLDLATHICDMWELADKEKRVANASYLPIRAAVRLAQGNPAGAKLDLETLDGPPARRIWARNIEGPSGLREAVGRNDRAFRYHPGPLPASYNAFPLPE